MPASVPKRKRILLHTDMRKGVNKCGKYPFFFAR